jgi:hypothetical protein
MIDRMTSRSTFIQGGDCHERACEGRAVVKRWLDLINGTATDVWESFKANFHDDATCHLIGTTPRFSTFRGLASIKKDFLEVGRKGDGRAPDRPCRG